MNSKILSAFLVLTLVLSIVVQSDAFAPPDNPNKKNGFRRQAADVAGCKKQQAVIQSFCEQVLPCPRERKLKEEFDFEKTADYHQ